MNPVFRLTIFFVFVLAFSVCGFVFYQDILAWVYPSVIVTDGNGLFSGALINAIAFCILAATIAFAYTRHPAKGLGRFLWAISLLVVGLGTLWLVLDYMRTDLASVENSVKGFGPVQISIENIKLYVAPLISIILIISMTLGKEVLSRRRMVSNWVPSESA
ncbi:hypothetical protein ACFOZ5_01260 [Marinobacter lacisalsi]|uniref:Uncharacterized protein n=1 Tax=Marinobacter lacisalsi TaxID=475979 RepID=A0ABV8QDY0_9GAMM